MSVATGALESPQPVIQPNMTLYDLSMQAAAFCDERNIRPTGSMINTSWNYQVGAPEVLVTVTVDAGDEHAAFHGMVPADQLHGLAPTVQ